MENNNRRIAKNTITLFCRLLLTIFISLYTSRVVLKALGVEDFGIYNVVAGFITSLAFLQGTLSATSSRFITVSIGKGDAGNSREVFSTIFFVNLLLAVVVVLVAETIGLWFLYNTLKIPEAKIMSAFWIYQISIVTVFLNIISVPYNALIIANEKMSVFAYISIYEAVMKLVIAYLVAYLAYNKLIVYAGGLLFLQISIRYLYSLYCLRKFEMARIQWVFNKALFKEVLRFIGWSSYGSFVTIGFTQGLNIILNIYFGPAINAARALSVQVQNAISGFITNFQTAINPQIIKSYTKRDFAYVRELLISSSKYSVFLLLLIALPVIAQTEYVLKLWLEDVPEHTANFTRLILLISGSYALKNPMRIVNQADGDIKKFQIYECTILLFIVPVSWCALYYYKIPELVFFVHFVLETIAHIVRLRIVLPKIGMTISSYLQNVIFKIVVVIVPSIIVAIVFNHYYLEETLVKFLVSSALVTVVSILGIYMFGLSMNEKQFLKGKMAQLISKK